ncbi:hypothetical protein MNQ98_04080 [Paenibacillus sp. N3/727]|uniref:hypothetical protein n=1 Tax=Paenibacillus sp. N3/727 TaxID=2925845 RepID=UPI001F53A94A|nr:hypothetical protein [Paenibacillus sp. N3/727]UNK19225.1 hypothetical protein MNQ98_04080 [Paenibacillus sp. N3/727]
MGKSMKKFSTKGWVVLVFGVTSLIVIGFTLWKWLSGQEVGFNEWGSIAIVLSAFLGAMTWGSKGDPEHISPEEELGRHISSQSFKASYFILLALALIVLVIEKIAYAHDNIGVIAVLLLGIIVLPATEYVVSRKFR